MPKDPKLQSVLVIGSGPIVIGQACEFDYSATQAIKVLESLHVPSPRPLRRGDPAQVVEEIEDENHVVLLGLSRFHGPEHRETPGGAGVGDLARCAGDGGQNGRGGRLGDL